MKSRNSRNRKKEPALPSEAPSPGLAQLFDVPQSAMLDVPQIELAGNREAVVEGCKGVLEYDESVIKLATSKMSIKFTGRGLQIKVLTHNSAVLEGFITGIEFLT